MALNRIPVLLGLAACATAWAHGGGHGGFPVKPPVQPPPSLPGTPSIVVPQPSRYDIGDYWQWWEVNRDDFLLVIAPEDPLARYERKTPPPDSLASLLDLVGTEGQFCTLSKEVGMRRLKAVPDAAGELSKMLGDRKAPAPQRAWAAYALGELRAETALPALKETLQDRDADVRGFCALALGKIGTPEALKTILPIASDAREGEDLRCLVLLCLAPSTLPEARRALIEAAQATPLAPRRSAILALGVRPSAEEAAALGKLAGHRDAPVRAAAVLALGMAGKGKELLRAGILERSQERDSLVRSCAALALGLWGNAEATPALLRCLEKDPDPAVKGCAALALGRTGGKGRVEALTEALENRRYGAVSDYAAVGLGLSRDPAAFPPLLKTLASKQKDVLIGGCIGLTLLGNPGAADSLSKAAQHRQYPDVREFALLALGKLRPPSALDRLITGLDDAQPYVRQSAALGLGILGDPKACPVLRKALAEKDADTRSLVALAFDLLTDDESLPLSSGTQHRGDPRNRTGRKVGPAEVRRLFNSYLPRDFKLPITP